MTPLRDRKRRLPEKVKRAELYVWWKSQTLFAKLEKNIMTILGGLIGGAAGGAVGATVIHVIVIYVGVPLQKVNHHPILLVFWGAIIGLGVAAGLSFGHPKRKINRLLNLIRGSIGAAITGVFGGAVISGTFWGGAILGGVFGFWITLGIQISALFVKEKNIKKDASYLIIGGVTGSLSAGATAGLLWGFLARGAHAEGYVLLATAMLAVLGMTWGLGIALAIYAFNENPSTSTKGVATALVIFLFIWAAILTIRGYGDKLIDDASITKAENHTSPSAVLSTYDKSEIIEFIKRKKDLGLSELTALYVLTEDKQYALKVKEILLKEAEEGRFTNPAHSVKSQQFDAAKRAVSYLEVEKIKELFSQKEKQEMVNWFKDIVNRIFSVEWVDYLYAVAFKRAPVGPYENQEIGAGALAVLAEIIEEEHPEIAKRARDFIDKHAVVWGGNFRNTDDSITYQSWWISNAFLVAKYRPMPEWSSNTNASDAFEWILKQWPPNGMALAYNDYHPANIADTMALGASLFHDRRYKWLAVKMLQQQDAGEDVGFPFYFGLVSWDDSLEPVRPSVGSSYLMGPGGLPHDPGPSMPDKIVFREGWEESSLYALLNLRYSGWHKYKATNSFVNITYGRPFVVEDFISKRHTWLPAGRSLYRDKKIDRIRLNGFQVGLEGYELLVHDILKIGTSWAQDPPRYAEVQYFQKTPGVEFSKTNLSKWRGWWNERISILLKDSYFAVFDKAERKKDGKVAISWHLKGSNKVERDTIHLNQDNYQMTVYYPHHDDWYQVETEDSSEEDPPAASIYSPDVDLYMISEGKSRVGFISLFAPERYNSSYTVEPINVEGSEGKYVYPDALGIRVDSNEGRDIIGVAFLRDAYKYGTVRTDAELFVLREESNKLIITYKNGSFFKIDSIKKPSELAINAHKLKENVDWRYLDGRLEIELPAGTEQVRVRYLQ